MKTPPHIRTACIIALLLPKLLLDLGAQTTETPTAEKETPSRTVQPTKVAGDSLDDEVIELSPFVVNTQKDDGYLATQTLGGTRLSTNLSDVGTSISVVTQNFLKDTGATDTGGLLTYITGSEVAGPSGNFLGGSAGSNLAPPSENIRTPQATTRLRGLASATEARNFYSTSIPLDGYIVERIEVNRGANSILFGTGSPAGIINATLKQAEMRNANSIEARTDSYGSFRGSFDFNRELIKDELALRVNGLQRRSKFQQDFAYSDDDRQYVALKYDPKWARTENEVLSGTVLRANYENGNMNSRRPRTLPPSDRITYWFQPFENGYPAKTTWNGSTQRAAGLSSAVQTTNHIFRNASVWFDNPDSANPGTGSTINGTSIVGRQGVISNLTSPAGTGVFASATDISTVAPRITSLVDASFYIRPVLTDETVFDFRNKLIEGPNRFEYSDFDATNVVLEQRFFGNRAGVQFEYDKQDFVTGWSALQEGGRETELSIDVNTTLMDGTPNPNYGRPFITGTWVNAWSRVVNETGRATAYYRFDFKDVVKSDLARWLGRVTFTGLHEQGYNRGKGLVGDRYATGTDYVYGNNQLITDASGGRLSQLSYVGPSLATATSAANANILGLNALQLPIAAAGQTFQLRRQAAGSTFVTTPITIIEDGLIPNQFATGASKTASDTRNQAAIVEAKTLQDLLVVVLGWRRDNVDNFTAAAPKRGVRNNLLVGDDVWVLPTTPTTSVSEESRTRSVVLHTPDFLVRKVPYLSRFSLRYNTSENFAPSGTRFDSNGTVLAPPSGTTKDIGFALGLAQDRVIMTATWFTTSQKDNSATGITSLTQQIVESWRLVKNLQGLGKNPNLSQVLAPPQELLDLYSFTYTNGTAAYVSRGDVVLTQDAISKGVEFEVNANITSRWRLTANASRQSAVRSNTGRVFEELFFDRTFNGQTLYESWTSAAAKQTFTDEGGGTLFDAANTRLINPFNSIALQDGGPAQELRKWRYNLVTNYTFSKQSLLKGFSIGGGARWQDRAAIGFPVISGPNNIRVPDVVNPYYGEREFNMDSWVKYERRIFNKMNWSLQLNVYNVLDRDDLIAVSTQPDGSIAGYRIPAERRLELTSRFEF